MELRPYQDEIITDCRSLMRSGQRRICITLPTGGGKTAIMTQMMRLAAARGKRCWFIVHRRELIKQSVKAFQAIGIKAGVVSAGWPETPHLPIQVCAIGSLKNRYQRLRAPDLIAWDECHHIAAASWQTIFNHYDKAFHVGLTATPVRLDGKGLSDYFQELVEGPSVSELIETSYLCKYKLYAPGGPDLSKTKRRMGDYIKSELSALMDKPTITGSAIKEYQRRAHGKRAIVFAVSIEHSKHIVEEFRRHGIPAEHIDGGVDKGYRDRAIARFVHGETWVLSNVDLVGEGFDLPAIECAILLRPTQSLSLYLQQVGRCLRTSPGKEEAIILDHANNSRAHGLPDSPRTWSLKGIERKSRSKEQDVKVKICEKCYGAQPPGSTACKFCGYLFPSKPREVDQVEGDLIEVDSDEAKKDRKLEQRRARTKEDLLALAYKRGYKRPHLWVSHIIRARRSKYGE